MKKKNVVPTAAGIAAITMAAGATAYFMNAKSMKGQRKKLMKTANTAAQAISGVVSDVVDTVTTNIMG